MLGVISLEQHVAAEEPAAALAEQGDVPVGVARQHEHVERLAGEIERVALVDQVRRLDGAIGSSSSSPAERSASSPACRGRAGSGRSAARVGIEPGAHRQVAIARALHDLLGAGQLGQARARPDVIGVVVRDHDAPHLRIAEQRERLAQRRPVPGVPSPQSISVQPSASSIA